MSSCFEFSFSFFLSRFARRRRGIKARQRYAGPARDRILLGVALLFTVHVSLVTAQVTQPMVAIHDSELTRALESMPASGSTPTGPGTTGNQWWPTDWHYFVMPEAVKEAMRSDGTAFTVVGDSNIVAGALLSGGAPKYPIVVSLASEAIRDDEIAAFTNYVAAGGYLFIGSSAFTRNTNGTARGDFAFANELGLHTLSALTNWAQNNNFVKTNQPNHRLVSHIPAGTNTWRMPSASEEIPWGISPGHPFLAPHDVWRVQATTATVLANGDATPFLTIKAYGKGYFIYCAAFQPLIGHSGFAPGMYAYVIVRRAIEWAFETAQTPVPKLSPWPFQYDAAWMIRHDLENFTNEIAAVEASAQVEFTNGARGDYYFCTGTLRDDAAPTYNVNTLIAGLRRATTNYGATIGPHNGGLKNPNNPSLTRGQYDYWHWGPDEALDVTPAGYPSGKAYATASISNSFKDVETWLSGITNGIRSWVGCYFNSTREDSYDLQAQLGIKIAGEQKLTPFPHWTLSTLTPGKRYAMLSEPVSDWFVGGLVAQSLEPWHYPGVQTSQTMHDGVDFYYGLGALINFYSHTLSTGLGDAGQLVPDYITYSLNTNIHPRLWSANAASVYQWWVARSNAQVSFTFATNNYQSLVNVSVRGATDPNTSVEVLVPGTNPVCTVQVWTNGNLASADNFRINGQLIKLRVGNAVTNAVISYYPLGGVAAIFTQNFDGVTAPALAAGWTTTASGVQTPWVTTTGTNNTAPNSAFSGDPANVGINELVSPAINLPGGASQLTFQNDYDLETGSGTDGFDGGVLEIKIGTNGFTDILAAGGTFVTGGYNSVIDTQWQNPLAGRAAWSGTSPGYITTTVNLPSASSGQPIQLRWRCGSDNSNGKTGWRIDSIKINNQACLCCNGTSNTPPVLNAQSDRTIAPLSTLTVNNAATDLDLPPQFLTYQLMTPPAGAAIDGKGVITWTPSNAQALTTNLIVTVVTDNGVPPMSATNAFTVYVSNTNTPPSITSQPVSVTNNVGTLASFSVTATGSSPSFQWVKNGSINLVNGGNISGANTPTLTINNVQMADAGSYSVMVSNSAGSVTSSSATLTVLNPYGTNLLADDFTRSGNPGALAPWVVDAGAWAVTNGMLNGGPSPAGQSYGYAYITNSWTNYSVQARVRFSSINSYGGGLGARVNPVTGAHYAAWIFPENSNVGSSILRIIKFQEWIAYEYTNVTFQPMVQANLPGVGTNWHTLQLNVQGNQISASYDGVVVASVTDTESNPLMTGGISADMYTETSTYTLSFDDVAVNPLPTVLMAANDAYFMAQGVMNNDTPGSSTNLSAARVSGPGRGTLTFNANGSFTYTPTNGFTGLDSFTYRLNDGVTNSTTATVAINVAPSTNVFYENFSRVGAGSTFAPWVVGVGEWNVTNATLQGASTIANDYSDAYIPADLTDFAIQARITLQSGGWAGGLSGRVNPSSGARYVANIYPEGSPLGPTPALRLIKFHSWNTWSSSFTPMALVNLPAVGTATHTLRMTFQGNQIAVYFDGNQIVNMADNNADGLPPYTHGAFGAHMYMDSPHVATFDDLYVTSLAVNTTNTAPVLTPQADRTIAALTTLTVTNAATDSDVPAQTLTYQLIAPPAGASISASGIITWTPTGGQAPSTNVITTVVTDNGSPPLSATNKFNVVVTPGNSAPVLSPQPNVTMAELTTLTVTNAANDSDVPPQSLTYSLLSPPAGATISSSGVISWIPSEAQGPGTYTLTTRVVDNGTPPLSATNSFTVTVSEVNVAPALAAQVNRTIAELTTLRLTNTATDADLPANTLTYSLIAPPPGATISPAGVITWTPSETQGPGTNVVTTVVTDNGSPPLSATNSFVVVVTEMNSAPVLPVQTNRTVPNQVAMVVTNTATDSDIPANNLTYSLVNPPTGAAIDTNGIINWTPTAAQTGTTNLITTIVADDGTPSLSATNQFTVVVSSSNSPPVLSPQPNVTMAELTTLVVTNTATDSDVPAQTLAYALQTPPAGATISSSGVISWTPGEAQGPGTNVITTVVTDNGAPPLSATNSFTVVVTERNNGPVLPAQTNRTIVNQVTLVVTNTATDADVPANALAYSLLNAPTGASIDTNGIITWTPTAAQTPGTNTITTVVTDNGAPPLSATNSFFVTVVDTNSVVTLFSEDFTRTNSPGTLSPWISQSGTWRISGGVLTGSAKGQGYGFLYLTNTWTNYSVEAQIRFSATAYAGGLGAYVNTGNGSRYAAWVYPETSAGGSNLLRLLKFKSWKNYSYTNGGSVPMGQANLPAVGTNLHNLKIALSGTQIAAYFDGNQLISVTDAEATPFISGAVSIDLRTGSTLDTMTVDNVVVKSIPGGDGAGPLVVPAGFGPEVMDAPVIESVRIVEGLAVVSWTAVPGNIYRLQYTSSLDTPDWQDATEDIVAMEGTVTATDTIGSSPRRFYRVLMAR
jgi:hypothetical protein